MGLQDDWTCEVCPVPLFVSSPTFSARVGFCAAASFFDEKPPKAIEGDVGELVGVHRVAIGIAYL